jgi:thiamine phosphate synthase YjbQ (UPF0047 family)
MLEKRRYRRPAKRRNLAEIGDAIKALVCQQHGKQGFLFFYKVHAPCLFR